MPVKMDLLDAHGDIYPNAADRVFTHMVFPNDLLERKFLATTEQYWNSFNDGKASSTQIDFRVYTTDHTIAFRKKVDSKVNRGLTSGSLLFFMWRCACHSHELATISRAESFAMKNMVHASPSGVSRSTVRSIWREFKPVAHLWAAAVTLWWSDPQSNICLPTDDNLRDFLGIADHFACFGTNHRPSPVKEYTTLDPKTLIAAPVGIAKSIAIDRWPLNEGELLFHSNYIKEPR